MGPLLFLHLFLSCQNFLIFSTWSISATFLFLFFYKIALFLNYFLLFTALVDVASLSSSIFDIFAWYRSFSSNISSAFYFSFMSFACSWIIFFFSLSWTIFYFSLSSFIALADNASDSSSLCVISAWARSFSLSLAFRPSALLYFYFSFISCACSWIIFCFSLHFFIALDDAASVSSNFLAISAWDRSLSFRFSVAAKIFLPYFSFFSICLACSWMIFSF